jgi:hypothetical protein
VHHRQCIGYGGSGRIRHHIKNNIEDKRNTILIVGWCAPHTLGSHLASGHKEVNIFGEPHRVRAHIATIDAFSGHADKNTLSDKSLAQPNPNVTLKQRIALTNDNALTWTFEKNMPLQPRPGPSSLNMGFELSLGHDLDVDLDRAGQQALLVGGRQGPGDLLLRQLKRKYRHPLEKSRPAGKGVSEPVGRPEDPILRDDGRDKGEGGRIEGRIFHERPVRDDGTVPAPAHLLPCPLLNGHCHLRGAHIEGRGGGAATRTGMPS